MKINDKTFRYDTSTGVITVKYDENDYCTVAGNVIKQLEFTANVYVNFGDRWCLSTYGNGYTFCGSNIETDFSNVYGISKEKPDGKICPHCCSKILKEKLSE